MFPTSNQYIQWCFEITETSTSTENNTSTVQFKVWARRTNTGYETWGTGSVNVTFNGSAYSANITPDMKITSSWIALGSWTATVPHNADGTKTVAISGSWSINSIVTASSQSWSLALTTIPRASSVTVANLKFGATATAAITRASPAFTHVVNWSVNGNTTTHEDVATSDTLLMDPAWAGSLAAGKALTATCTVDTYQGDVKIGSKSVSFTVTMPDASSVTVGAILFGGTATATITRALASFTHKVEWDVNGGTETDTGVATSATCVAQLAWAKTLTAGQTVTATCKVTTYNGTVAIGSVTKSFVVTMLAASTAAVTATAFGSAVGVAITRANSALTHAVTWKVGSHTNTVTGTGVSFSYTIPASWADAVASAVSADGTVTVDTYNGTTKIGSVVVPFTLAVPATYVPTTGALNVARVDGMVPSAWGLYVQGKSKATLSLPDAAGSNGSSVTSKTLSARLSTASADLASGTGDSNYSLTTGYLPAGTIGLTGKVTDSRGRVSTAVTGSITVWPWSAPVLKSVSAQRWTTGGAQGKQSDTGTYIRLLVTDEVALVNGKNTFTRTYRWRRVGTDTWTSGQYTSGTALWLSGASTEYSYEVEVTVTDAFSIIVKSVKVSSALVTMDFRAGGKGIAVGKVSEKDGLDAAWQAWFANRVDFAVRSYHNGGLTVSSDLLVDLTDATDPTALDPVLRATVAYGPDKTATTKTVIMTVPGQVANDTQVFGLGGGVSALTGGNACGALKQVIDGVHTDGTPLERHPYEPASYDTNWAVIAAQGHVVLEAGAGSGASVIDSRKPLVWLNSSTGYLLPAHSTAAAPKGMLGNASYPWASAHLAALSLDGKSLTLPVPTALGGTGITAIATVDAPAVEPVPDLAWTDIAYRDIKIELATDPDTGAVIPIEVPAFAIVRIANTGGTVMAAYHYNGGSAGLVLVGSSGSHLYWRNPIPATLRITSTNSILRVLYRGARPNETASVAAKGVTLYLFKQGKTVWAKFADNPTSAIASGSALWTVPAGFRPASSATMVVVAAGGVYSPGSVDVGTNGACAYWGNTAGGTTSNYAGFGVWMTP
jgi:hypothetical protein